MHRGDLGVRELGEAVVGQEVVVCAARKQLVAICASNALTESANVQIKSICRAACGFRNCTNYAARIRLHAGQPRRVPNTTRIRPYTFTTAA